MDDGSKQPAWHVRPKQRARARSLRRDLNAAERIICCELRALEGIGFRRQTPIRRYIVDFVSHTEKLILEIDGGEHFEADPMQRDERRDAFLARKGYRVLRFNNNDVIANHTGVLEAIASACAHGKAPSPPSPASAGGGASTDFQP